MAGKKGKQGLDPTLSVQPVDALDQPVEPKKKKKKSDPFADPNAVEGTSETNVSPEVSSSHSGDSSSGERIPADERIDEDGPDDTDLLAKKSKKKSKKRKTKQPDASESSVDDDGSDDDGVDEVDIDIDIDIDIDAVVAEIDDALESGDTLGVRESIEDLHISDQARVIDRLRGEDRIQFIQLIAEDLDPQILIWVNENAQEDLIATLGADKFAAALSELETDDAVAVLEDLEAEDQAKILASVPSTDRAEIEEGLSYPEYSAGRLMQRDLVAIPDHWTIGETIDHLRATDDLPDDFYDLFVVDGAYHPVGQIPLSRMLRSRRPVKIIDVMDEEFRTIPVLMDQEEVAALFRKYGLVSAAAVDPNDRLVGVITVDDVVDVIDEEAEDDLLRLGGVAEADVYDTVMETTKSRFPWLALNLVTAVAASAVIAVFEGTIEQIVALAILMPIVASMGGNAGTQTLTVAVRALAMKELTPGNAWQVIGREVCVGLLNGLGFAVVTGGLSALWAGSWEIGALLGAAMVINMVIAGLAGAVIPFGLSRMKVDPAVSSGVFLTTVTDVVGFFAFLGLAALFLL
ncbi:MAG: magnesium transporter [Pseudomonadota bacterium]